MEEHPDIDREWYEKSNNIVVLNAPNKEELAKIAYGLSKQGFAVCVFKEPDLNDELTAIAVEPRAGKEPLLFSLGSSAGCLVPPSGFEPEH